MPIERLSERLAIMWPIRYEAVAGQWGWQTGSLLERGDGRDASSAGPGAPLKDEVLQLHITDVNNACTRTLAEVRWIRPGRSWFKQSVLAGVRYVDV
jgi:hypothetical protein